MTASQLATQIINRRGGKEAFASTKQAWWLIDLCRREGFTDDENPGAGRETYYVPANDSDDAIRISAPSSRTTAKLERCGAYYLQMAG